MPLNKANKINLRAPLFISSFDIDWIKFGTREIVFISKKVTIRVKIVALPMYLKQFKKWAILVGPEGGFSEIETQEILSIPSTIPVSLGKRILRSDTATTAALFSVQSLIE